MKELPLPTKGERWWGTPERVSDRLKVEFEAMRDLFKKGEPALVKLPCSNWDVEEILLFTHSLKFRLIKDSMDYDATWAVDFSIDDNGHLCRPTDIFSMHLFYPKDYPFKAPDIAFEKERKTVVGESHNFPGIKTVGGKTYNIICHIDHASTNFLKGHDPARTNTAMHALRAILWLRSQLNSAKHHKSMLNYG